MKFITPPHQIMLSTEILPGPKNALGNARYLKPYPEGSHSIHSYSFWEILDDGSIFISFSTGYSGLFMTLTVSGDKLLGTAETFWDFPRQTQTAEVQLKRIQ